jgi:hypothetical protein
MSTHHPIWAIVHTVVASICVTAGFAICAWVTATNFDETELKMLGGGGALATLILGLFRGVVR